MVCNGKVCIMVHGHVCNICGYLCMHTVVHPYKYECLLALNKMSICKQRNRHPLKKKNKKKSRELAGYQGGKGELASY